MQSRPFPELEPAVGDEVRTPVHGVTLRPGHEDDQPDILRIWRAASRVGRPFLSEAELDQDEAKIASEHLHAASMTVALYDRQVVGFSATLGGYIGALFVSPELHGRGIGRQLLERLKQTHDQLQLGVYEANPDARRLYDRAGFAVAGRDPTDEGGRPFPVLRMTWRADRVTGG